MGLVGEAGGPHPGRVGGHRDGARAAPAKVRVEGPKSVLDGTPIRPLSLQRAADNARPVWRARRTTATHNCGTFFAPAWQHRPRSHCTP
jgi:hypothetical protein